MDIIFYVSYYWNWLTAQFIGYPMVIKTTIILVGALLLMYCFSLFRFFRTHKVKSDYQRTRNNQEKQLIERLQNILYAAENYKETEINQMLKDDKHLVKRNYQKRVFTDFIVAMTETGQANHNKINLNNYVLVLDCFGIIDYWNKIMGARSPKLKQEAIRALDDLNVGLSGASIQQSVYHKNGNLRKNARAAMMKYNINDPYKFLEEGFDMGFNAMDEIRLHYYLSEQAKQSALPQLISWVDAPDTKYRAFLIREIGFFKQTGSCGALLDLFKTENNIAVKCEIVNSLGIMKYKLAKDVFMESYEVSHKMVQRSIIKSLPKLGGLEVLDFLITIYNQTFDSDTKTQLAYAIGQYGEQGKSRLKAVVVNKSEFDQTLYAQVDYQLN